MTAQPTLPSWGDTETKVRRIRLSYVLSSPITDGPHETPEFLDSGIPFLSVDNFVDGRLSFDNVRFISRRAHNEYAVKCRPARGDVLITKAASVGKVAVVDTDLEFSIWSPIALLRPNAEKLVSRYLYYCLQSADVRRQLSDASTKNTQSNIAMSDLAALRILLRPPSEQRTIADDLDREMAEIDALIDRKQRMIALLAEREARAFQGAVERRGVVFPRDLEADWRDGQLPDGWRLMHLSRALVQLTNGYVGPTRDILVADGIPYIQSVHIKGGRIDFGRRPFFVARAWHDERPRIHLRAGDVLIVQTGDIGQVAVVPEGFGEASCHALQIARVRRDLLSGEYLGAYLRSPFGYQSLLCRATGALHPHLEASIRDVAVVIPPKSAQVQILSEVNRDQERDRVLSGKLVYEIALLRERREAVIEAVTGPLDLHEAG